MVDKFFLGYFEERQVPLSKVSGLKATLMASVALSVVFVSEYAEAEISQSEDVIHAMRTSTSIANDTIDVRPKTQSMPTDEMSQDTETGTAAVTLDGLKSELAELEAEKDKTLSGKAANAAEHLVREGAAQTLVYYGTPVVADGITYGAAYAATAVCGPLAYYPAKVAVGGVLYNGAYVGATLRYVGFEYIPNMIRTVGQRVSQYVSPANTEETPIEPTSPEAIKNKRIAELKTEIAGLEAEKTTAVVEKATQATTTVADVAVREVTSRAVAYYGTQRTVEFVADSTARLATKVYGSWVYYPTKVMVGGALYKGAYVGGTLGYVGYHHIPNATYAAGRAVYNGGRYFAQRFAPSFFGAPVQPAPMLQTANG